jgi:hypothetical protein
VLYRAPEDVHAITYLHGQGSVLHFWRRLQQHREAVDKAEEAQAHGRKAPPVGIDNPIMLAYNRAGEMWRKKLNPEGSQNGW